MAGRHAVFSSAGCFHECHETELKEETMGSMIGRAAVLFAIGIGAWSLAPKPAIGAEAGPEWFCDATSTSGKCCECVNTPLTLVCQWTTARGYSWAQKCRTGDNTVICVGDGTCQIEP
jgi:hypothetical protein